MPLVPIDDPADARLVDYRSLKATNETRDRPRFVVEGEKLLDRLLGSRYPVDSVLVSARVADRIAAKVADPVPIYVLDQARIGGVVGYNFHQGVLACGRRVADDRPEAVVDRAGESAILVVAPTLHNPENLGSIVRTAEVLGAAGVMVGPGCPDPLSRRVLRVSMGTSLVLPVLAVDRLAEALDRLGRERGVVPVATVTDPGATPIRDFARDRPGRLALLLGTEAHGLAPEWVERCRHRVTIPMRPGAESLNVAIAAAICLHELAAGVQPPV